MMDLLKRITREKTEALQAAKQRRWQEQEGTATGTAYSRNRNGAETNKGGKVYLRRADIDEAEREYSTNKTARGKQGDETQDTETHTKRRKSTHSHQRPFKGGEDAEASTTTVGKQSDEQLEQLYPQAEVTKSLRRYGQVVRYFGETDRERIERMLRYEAEIGEELAVGEHYGDFAKTKQGEKESGEFHVNTSTADPQKRYPKKKEDGDGAAAPEEQEEGSDDDSQDETTPSKDANAKKRKYYINCAMDLHRYRFDTEHKMSDWKFVYRFFRQLLKEWEARLSKRDAEYAKTAQGKQEVRYYKENKDSLRPFFRSCKKKDLPEAVLEHVVRMAEYCLKREYRLVRNGIVYSVLYLRTGIFSHMWTYRP
eukprot:gb/GECG01013657.1/.p1 GENE.gb/GECG01013657.1/~~gb/GECG01013657.1/.p1  ORF type:complete len:368 (+),score=69.18 gb/GECG01013657.1/:1-1104(+)